MGPLFTVTMPEFPLPPEWVSEALHSGLVIPAHPLALDDNRTFDERRQRGLSRYYHAAGAGAAAVGVHTTQFAIRDAKHGLLEPVLSLAAQTFRDRDQATSRRSVLVAGICGSTQQACAEAALARDCGYHVGLISLAGLQNATDEALISHCREIARTIPLFGFYLQPAVGGRRLSVDFWRSFAEISNVVAIKVAPFNRYQTLDVVRAVAEAGRAGEIALYTGNDDNIVIDLLTEFAVPTAAGVTQLRFRGGLLGHWACQTRCAVRLLDECRAAVRSPDGMPSRLLTLAAQITEINAAFFDAANNYRGCIAGILEVLRRQGLLANHLCLEPKEALSPGQAREIDRVLTAWPELTDDAFIASHLDEWLA